MNTCKVRYGDICGTSFGFLRPDGKQFERGAGGRDPFEPHPVLPGSSTAARTHEAPGRATMGP